MSRPRIYIWPSREWIEIRGHVHTMENFTVELLMQGTASNDSNASYFNYTPHHGGNVSTPEPPVSRRPVWELVVLGVLLGITILGVLCGNLLVMVTIMTTRKLQCPTNYFILSLATTDFFLGCLVLPFSAVLTLHWEWPLGTVFCNIYVSFDVMLCTVSILNLFAISLDRYFAVTMPLRYQQKVNSRRVWKLCGGIWVFSFVLAFIPIHLGWNTMDGKVQNYRDPKNCVLELNKVYVLLDSIGTYFAPLLIMCAVYMKVLIITKRQVQEINKLNKAGQVKGMLKSQQEKRRQAHLASDTKATITLASLVLAFAVCWIPYFTLFTLKPFVDLNVNPHVDLFCLWLGYLNSLINPFLYAYYNSGFRMAFARILCRSCLKKQVYISRGHHMTSFTDSSEVTALNGKNHV